jgi:hypothetical protein
LARRGGFKSDKRRKELLRLQKQEEKRQRRFSGKTETEAESDGSEVIAEESEATQPVSEADKSEETA